MSDKNSTGSAGKKETLTKGEEKKQKRYLCDMMLNLHAKFKAENPGVKMQYARFVICNLTSLIIKHVRQVKKFSRCSWVQVELR